MIQRTIQIFMKIPDISQPFGIYTSSYDAGRVGDSGTTQLVFQRPEQYQSNNLRLLFQVGYNDVIQVDLGQSNTFTLTTAQTKQTTFVLQVEFTDGDGVIVASNKLTYYLTSSISRNNCSYNDQDYIQELLQFALSQKVNEMRFIQEVTEDKSTDPETAPWRMVGFNHMGDMILDLTLPQNYTARAGIADVATKALNADSAATADKSGYSKEFGKFIMTGTSSDTRVLGVSFEIPVNILQSANLQLMYRGSKVNSVSVSTLTNNTYSFNNQTYLTDTVFPELQLVLEGSIGGVVTPLYTFTFETYGTIDANNYYGYLKLKQD